MRHFNQIGDARRDRLFEIAPEEFDATSDPELIAAALGATLYSPATRTDLAEQLDRQARQGVTSMVICLEDSVPDHLVETAEDNLVEALRVEHRLLPLVFIRVRDGEQMIRVADRLGPALTRVAGFVLPKFGPDTGEAMLAAVTRCRDDHQVPLRCMPVLETPDLAYLQTRGQTLDWILRTCRAHRDLILAIRIGATDLSGLFALRRPPELTVYDVRVVSMIIGDIVNHLARADGGFTVTGPVWEYFTAAERIFRPSLRQTLFEEHDASDLRAELIRRTMDGLIREVELDKANGLSGKTVIHPSHVPVVNALQVVTHEEYADASVILATESVGGVPASQYRNKMNETKPHLAWARRTVLRARAFGVAAPDVTFVDVLAASLPG